MEDRWLALRRFVFRVASFPPPFKGTRARIPTPGASPVPVAPPMKVRSAPGAQCWIRASDEPRFDSRIGVVDPRRRSRRYLMTGDYPGLTLHDHGREPMLLRISIGQKSEPREADRHHRPVDGSGSTELDLAPNSIW